jgi:hypothetical protein
MANPNIVNVTDIRGTTTYLIPSNTSANTLLSNAASSGKIFKVNFISVANVTGGGVVTTVSVNSAAAGGGTNYRLAYQITVPINAALIITDKSTSFYLMENQSIVVISGTSSALEYVCSYEEIT